MANLTEELTSLKQLLDTGIITQAEFDAKKAFLLEKGAQPAASRSKNSTGWLIIGFLLPIAGAIIFVAMMNSDREAAMSAGKGALIGVGLTAISSILLLSTLISATI